MEHPLLQSYGPFEGWQLLAILGTISIGFFTYQVQKAVRLVMIGSSDDRFDSWGTRIGVFLSGWLGQKKVLRDRVAGTMHVLMFWGFLMLASDMFDLATANAFSGKLLHGRPRPDGVSPAMFLPRGKEQVHLFSSATSHFEANTLIKFYF